MSKIKLPSILTEESWFYEEHKELLEKYLGWKYVSYSTLTSYDDYLDSFVKSKIVGVRDEGSIYTSAGTVTGHILEHGELPTDIPEGIKIADDFDISVIRNPKAEFEKLVVLELFDDVIMIGFCDMVETLEDGSLTVTDLKTGADNKRSYYQSEKYYQLVIYAYALEKMGYKVRDIKVQFALRTGSHLNKPLVINNDFTCYPLEYSPERVKYALEKVDKAVEGISKLKTTYDKLMK